MLQILITAGQFLLIIISLFLILVVLMQRANTNAGLGAAFGGGLTESAFGTEAGSVMSKATWGGAILFFVVGLSLYLAIIHVRSTQRAQSAGGLFKEEAAAETTQQPEAPATTQPNADVQTAPAGPVEPAGTAAPATNTGAPATTPTPATSQPTTSTEPKPDAAAPVVQTPAPVAPAATTPEASTPQPQPEPAK